MKTNLNIISSIFQKDYQICQKIQKLFYRFEKQSPVSLKQFNQLIYGHYDCMDSLLAVFEDKYKFNREKNSLSNIIRFKFVDESYTGHLYSESNSLSLYDVLEKNSRNEIVPFEKSEPEITQIRINQIIRFSVHILYNHYFDVFDNLDMFKDLCLYQIIHIIKNYMRFDFTSISLIRKRTNETIDYMMNSLMTGEYKKPYSKYQPVFTNCDPRTAHRLSGQLRMEFATCWIKSFVSSYYKETQSYPTREEIKEEITKQIECLDKNKRKLFSETKIDPKTLKKWIDNAGFAEIKFPRSKNKISN